VVAAEVRTLAQNSGRAAKDVASLIRASANEVTDGVRLVRAAGDALERIVDASNNVSAMVAKVSAATAEQANGIGEMSQAITQMDKMTQQNAALSEESAATAATLIQQIGQLNALVATFKTAVNRPQAFVPAPARRVA
jgi:methyl-accepting chemotaxis protein